MKRILIAIAALTLAACGDGFTLKTKNSGNNATETSASNSAGGSGSGPVLTVPTGPPTEEGASRMLAQASFGESDATIQQVMRAGYDGWITQQLAIAPSAPTHQAYLEQRLTEIMKFNSSLRLEPSHFYESWWRTAVTAPDPLRQRVAFAYSQIFVISLNDPGVDIRGARSYYYLLTANAFGNFRKILEDVTLHPMMGRYLTYLGNQREDSSGTRKPDENYAREVMQLMTIGLVELNLDGTPRLEQLGQRIPTYTQADIAGLAKVFTGLSWYHPQPNTGTFYGGAFDERALTRPMIFYPEFHSVTEKKFLGTTIPASTTVNVGGDLKIALDTLFNHPNVGPFIGRQLIQRLVTSNPSPAYVGRVAAVFADNGRGRRGDLAAVVRAVLLDPEARNPAIAARPDYGKLREPLLRYTAIWRAFGAQGVGVANSAGAVNGIFRFYSSDTLLAQAPLSAPSVFNFYCPNYRKPGEIRERGLFSPEFQIVNDNTAIGMANRLHGALFNSDREVAVNRMLASPVTTLGRLPLDFRAEKALATRPADLVNRLDLLMMSGGMPAEMRRILVDAVGRMPVADGGRQRVEDVVFLVASSAQYSVQR